MIPGVIANDTERGRRLRCCCTAAFRRAAESPAGHDGTLRAGVPRLRGARSGEGMGDGVPLVPWRDLRVPCWSDDDDDDAPAPRAIASRAFALDHEGGRLEDAAMPCPGTRSGDATGDGPGLGLW